MYAKLKDGDLEYAPRAVTIGQTHYNPTPVSWLSEHGYKPLRYTDAPEQDGFYAEPSWTETETEIVQEWTLVPVPETDGYTEEELQEKSNAELTDILAEMGISANMTKMNMIRLILSAQGV